MGSLRVRLRGGKEVVEAVARWARERGVAVVEQKEVGLLLDLGPDHGVWDGALRELDDVVGRGKGPDGSHLTTYLSDSPECSSPGHTVFEVAGRTLRLVGGEAFGSGAHPTTRGCLEALRFLASRGLLQGGSLLDVGTGSGILALAAKALGAGRVVALEIDPLAASEARRNLAVNGFGGEVALVRGGPEALGGRGGFQVVTANLVPAVMASLLSHLCRLCRGGGFLILSGSRAADPPPLPPPYSGRELRRWRVDGWLTAIIEKTDGEGERI